MSQPRTGWAGFIHPNAADPDMARAAAMVISDIQTKPERLAKVRDRVLNVARDNGLVLHLFPASIH